MKKKMLISSLAVFLSLSTFAFAISSGNINKTDSPALATQHIDNFDSYTYSGTYYDGLSDDVTQGMSGTLRSELTDLIHPGSVPSYSSGLAEHLQYADEDPTNSSNMIYLYTRDSVKKNAASSWNREHVWPKSLSNGCWKESRAGSDLLHLRPTYDKTNSTRSNDVYGSASNVLTYNGMVYGKNGNGYFEPLDSVKGDVARICMYVWVAYHDEYGSKLPSLTSVFKDFDTLIEWHVLDKPDVMEGNRNNYAETSIQENRNPFVDHPEYAWMIFGNQCSSDVLAEAKEAYPEDGASITISDSNKTIQTGKTTTISATSSDGSNISWTTSNSSVCSISSSSSNSGSPITLTAGSSAGSATITAKATIDGKNYSATCAVTVTSATPTLVSISVSGMKTTYYVGDTFSFDGVCTATYSDSSTQTVTPTSVSSPDMTTTGEKTVTVSYNGVSTTYQISVYDQSGEAGTYDVTYYHGEAGEKWTVSNSTHPSGYILCPDGSSETSVAVFPDVFEDKYITSDVVITINCATYGSGGLPSSSTFTIYNSSDCSSQVSANQTGNLPTSSTYTNAVYTVTQESASAFSDDLVIKITKPGRQMRIKSVVVHFDYISGGPVPTRTLDYIELSGDYQVEFNVGDAFDYEGLIVTAYYDDDTSSPVEPNSVSTPDMSTAGDKEVTVTYSENGVTRTATYEITVFNIYLTELYVLPDAEYTQFDVGESFSFYGTITATYSDGSKKDIDPDDCAFSGFDSSTTGYKHITVTYTEGTITVEDGYAIYVNATGIYAEVEKTFYVGDKITIDDITVRNDADEPISGALFRPNGIDDDTDYYQFTYEDAAPGGALTEKIIYGSVYFSTYQCSVTVQVQRKPRESISGEVSDVLTANLLRATDTTYMPFNNVSVSSDAVYKGQSAKTSSGGIQLRSKNEDSGIVTTESGGKVKSVSIVVESGTKRIDVYGKNSAYSAATDLFDDSSSVQGTLIGSLTSTGTITVSGDYEYIGIRSNNGAIYLTSITITYETDSGDNAENLANYIMFEDTENQCKTKLSIALGYLNDLSYEEQNNFVESEEYVIKTARTRLNAWAKSQGKSIEYVNNVYVLTTLKSINNIENDDSNIIIIMTIMATLTIVSLTACIVIKKKKGLKR